MQMCQKVHAEYWCSDMHEYKNEERTRVKYFMQYFIAEVNEITCSSAQQKDVHIL